MILSSLSKLLHQAKPQKTQQNKQDIHIYCYITKIHDSRCWMTTYMLCQPGEDPVVITRGLPGYTPDKVAAQLSAVYSSLETLTAIRKLWFSGLIFELEDRKAAKILRTGWTPDTTSRQQAIFDTLKVLQKNTGCRIEFRAPFFHSRKFRDIRRYLINLLDD